MDILEQKDFEQLLKTTGEWCVSIYMPAHRTGREMQQDPIRLKKLIARTEEELVGSDVNRLKIQEWLQPAEKLLSDSEFWQHQSDGLAVFLAPQFSRVYRLPFNFDELTVIGRNFHIKPLLPLLNENGQFYILALSQNEIRLLLCTRDTAEQVELSDTPASMQEALFVDDPEKHLDFHTGSKNPSAPGSRPAVFHGQGGPSNEDEKKDILRYFHIVNKGITDATKETSIPMVLAGVDYLLPIYHEANTYQWILKEGMEGNPDDLSDKELQERGWQLVESVFNADKEKALQQFMRLHGQQSELASQDLGKVVKAATHGQVDTLFVPLGVQVWGKFDPQNNKVIFEKNPSLENEDLLDYAASQTILNSGQVFATQPDDLPMDNGLAAILRYKV